MELRQLRGWLLRLFGLFRHQQRESEFAEELASHLAFHIEDNLRAGMSPEEARRRALLKLGGVTQTQELYREQRGLPMLETLIQDLRYGLRMMLKSKMFTTVAVLSLALGIGANTAIFSLINALMLRMLPVKDAQELVLFSIAGPNVLPGPQTDSFNYPLYERFRDQNKSFAGILAGNRATPARLLVNEPGASAESVQQQTVSGNFFSVLGVNAAVGRTFTEADDNLAQPAAVISYEFWQRRFGLDPKVVGQRLTVDNIALTIVGVAPPGFFGFEVGSKPELWWTLKATNGRLLREPIGWWLRVVGRLRPGVSVAQAQAEIDLLFRQHNDAVAADRSADWSPTQRQKHFERNIRLEAGGAGYTRLRQELRQPLFILVTTVALVLLIACVNLANLLLARAATRRKEMAVRLALGAGRFRLLRQLLTESVLLSLLGGAVGLLFARACLRVLLTFLPQLNRGALDVPLDARVLGFTLVVSILTGLVFGLMPAWQTTRPDLTDSLKEQSGASVSQSRLKLNNVLVVTQVALSLYLLIGAGLFVRTLRNLQTLDVGFNYDNIVQFALDTGSGYDTPRYSQLHKQLLARLEALPGAHSATLSKFGLLGNLDYTLKISIPGYSPAPDETMDCHVLEVGPRFFETMKMPLLAGRDFSSQDERPLASPDNGRAATAAPHQAPALPRFAVVNQTMARAFFGNENAVGKRFIESGQEIEIVGVVKDAKYATLREQPPRTYYLYYFQQSYRGGMKIQLRTNGNAAEYAAAIRNLMRELDPQLRVIELQTMTDAVDELLVQERFIASTSSAFSLFALLLACIGLYGVMSYAVTRRTTEIGIRMALGAQTYNVVWLVMREVSLLVVLGIGIGLAAALVTTRYVSTLLFDLTPTDPLTITVATLLLMSVAALAGYLPARRAAKVNPMIALRHD